MKIALLDIDGVVLDLVGAVPDGVANENLAVAHRFVEVGHIYNREKHEFLPSSPRENVLRALASIDLKSARAMREFLTKKFAADPDLPAELLAHENNAKAERAKLK